MVQLYFQLLLKNILQFTGRSVTEKKYMLSISKYKQTTWTDLWYIVIVHLLDDI